jgi:hypothetical protein
MMTEALKAAIQDSIKHSIQNPPAPEMLPKPCALCPSAHYPMDPEAELLSRQSFDIRLEAAFACGWNQTRYCRGYCDKNGITNKDLEQKHSHD